MRYKYGTLYAYICMHYQLNGSAVSNKENCSILFLNFNKDLRMKTSITTIAKVASGLALMAASSVAMSAIMNTKHNLSSSQTTGNYSNSTEICIFCHTPHGGNQEVIAPLWNRNVTSDGAYTRFSSMGRYSFKESGEVAIGGISQACLSCHDGTQSMNSVINGPGSGNNSNEASATSWSETGTLSTMLASDNGELAGDLIYIGTDLRNDHPISMQYGNGGLNDTTPWAAVNSPGEFAGNNGGAGGTGAVTNGSTTMTGVVNYYTVGNQPRWYIDTGGGTTGITDGGVGYQNSDFPLYSRDAITPGNVEPFVECGTCHDPHSTNPTFLRLSGGNTRSQVCLVCHNT